VVVQELDHPQPEPQSLLALQAVDERQNRLAGADGGESLQRGEPHARRAVRGEPPGELEGERLAELGRARERGETQPRFTIRRRPANGGERRLGLDRDRSAERLGAHLPRPSLAGELAEVLRQLLDLADELAAPGEPLDRPEQELREERIGAADPAEEVFPLERHLEAS